MATPPLTKITAFVDWDTARRGVRWVDTTLQDAQDSAHRVIVYLQESIAAQADEIVPSGGATVCWRAYHGWHRGRTPTQDRRALEGLTGTLARRYGKMAFDSGLEFGNLLLCGGPGAVLLDTLRRREDGSDEQKMVDTSLACDLLCFARAGDRGSRMAIVVSDDDDVLPAVIAAASWGLRVRILRRRKIDNPHNDTERFMLTKRLA